MREGLMAIFGVEALEHCEGVENSVVAGWFAEELVVAEVAEEVSATIFPLFQPSLTSAHYFTGITCEAESATIFLRHFPSVAISPDGKLSSQSFKLIEDIFNVTLRPHQDKQVLIGLEQSEKKGNIMKGVIKNCDMTQNILQKGTMLTLRRGVSRV